MFIRGEVADHKGTRLPTSAEFGKECRSNHRAIEAARNRKIALSKPEERFEHSYEHRMKMLRLFETLKKALAGSKQAQKELEPWGWKQ